MARKAPPQAAFMVAAGSDVLYGVSCGLQQLRSRACIGQPKNRTSPLSFRRLTMSKQQQHQMQKWE